MREFTRHTDKGEEVIVYPVIWGQDEEGQLYSRTARKEWKRVGDRTESEESAE